MSTLRLDTISNSGGTKSVPANTVIDGSAKAWVNFNGTGTVAIRASFNVTSITDNGVGDYTVNFTSAMADANFAATVVIGDAAVTAASAGRGACPIAYATGSCRVVATTGTGAATDYGFMNVAIFR